MSLTALALLISAALYTGFQWTIRSLVYPQFDAVPPAEFARYERTHQRRVSITVGPLFAAMLASTGALVLAPPRTASWWLVLAAVLLIVAILGVTWLMAVPLHRSLSARFDPSAYRRLLAVDSIRLAAAVLDVVVAAILVLR